MQIKEFKKLKDDESKMLKGGWTCPKRRSDVAKKLKTLSYAQQKNIFSLYMKTVQYHQNRN